MRGGDERSGSLFSYVDLEARVGKDHPIGIIRGVVNEALAALAGEFSALYSRSGRPSIPPEKLLRAMLLQAFYSIRSERQLMERLEFDLLFRWFVGVGVDNAALDHSTFSKNRERLLEGDIAAKLLSAAMAQPRVKRLLSTDHFSVDGTLIEAWASMKSFRPKDGSGDPPTAGGGRNREADFHGQKRSNETHASTANPEAWLYRKGPGKETKLCFMGHALMENRNGLVVDACLTEANGHAALHMIEPRADRSKPVTLGADKAYDAEDFANELRSMNATPHVAQNANGRCSAIDGRTTRHAGYAVSQRIRKRIEEALGWIKTVGGQERTKFRGRERVGWALTSQPPPTIWLGCRSFWRPRLESSGQLPTDWPLADRRVRSLGSSSSRSEWPGDADDHRARRRNRLRRLGGRPRSRIRPRLDRVSTGPDARKAMRSREKEPPNFSTTAPPRSSSPTTTATKPSSKQNKTLLQQPASPLNAAL
jgi:transposase